FMAKPAPGTAINTSDSQGLATGLLAAWGMLEGSGSTSADSTGNGYTLTLDGTVSWTTIGSDPALSFAGSPSTPYKPASLASELIRAGASTNDWSVAFRAKQTVSGTNGMVFGDAATPDYCWLDGGNYLEFSATVANYNFTGVTLFTADHDYVLSYNHTGTQLSLYQDGTLIAAASASCDLKITTLGAGYTNAT